MTKRTATVLLVLSVTGLLIHWGRLLLLEAWTRQSEDLFDLGRLARYLLGIAILLAGIWLLAHANYHWAFRRWLLHPATRVHYWLWLSLLTWILFEVLQYRTQYETEFVNANLLVTTLLLGLIITYSYIADYFRTRREQLQLQQQKAEAELTMLKAHINPHFLFNALNTIYNEAQRARNEQVSDQIQQLSGIMRFTLQEAKESFISVEKELAFLEKYLALQRARLPRNSGIRIETELDWDGQPAQIAPLLLIPFIENAFQYGVSMDQDSYIQLTVTIEEGQLQLKIENSLAPAYLANKGLGTGIGTTRQRLELLYPQRHRLQIRPSTDRFSVFLDITLH